MDEAGRRSILVVDTDVMNLRFLRETISSFSTCRVDTSPNSPYAFELSLKKDYDLFIFEIGMPEVDGVTLYSFIRMSYDHDGGRRLPPLLFMAGTERREKVSEALREPGVRGVLGKPFTIERLLQKLAESLPQVEFGNPTATPRG